MFWGRKKREQESDSQKLGVTSQLASAATDVQEPPPAAPPAAPPTEEHVPRLGKPTALEFGVTERQGANLLTGVCSIGEGGPLIGACEWKVTKTKDRRPTPLYRILF
ncbi:hypothetical protein BSKO_04462 [Bryopsis sp. KO-2023]|nr:hypothetical protein BSKO_04462 [Bryopsis sp. KO-2023]